MVNNKYTLLLLMQYTIISYSQELYILVNSRGNYLQNKMLHYTSVKKYQKIKK